MPSRISFESVPGLLPYEPIAAPFLPKAPTIAPAAAQETFAISRPKLSPPQHYFLTILAMHNNAEASSARHLDLIKETIQRSSNELDHLNLKKAEEVQKHAEVVTEEKTWSQFSAVAEYFSYALSLVTGTALVATGVGSVAGSFLIAAGGLGLANRVLVDTNGWKNLSAYFTKSIELQTTISQWTSSSFSFLSMGFGLAGGVFALQSGGLRLIDAALSTEKFIEKLTVITGLSTSTIHMGVTIKQKQISNALAVLQKIDGPLFEARQTLSENSQEAKAEVNLMQTITRQTVKEGEQ